MSMSSRPWLLNSMTWVMRRMLAARSAVFDADRNPVLKWMFHQTFYSQFCSGEREALVRQSISDLQKQGYDGVILEYASEVLEGQGEGSVAQDLEQVLRWRDGLLKTIEMVNPGDFVGLKWSGMGSDALDRMKHGLPPSSGMLEAMIALCEAAAAKGVKLLPAAEPHYAQLQVDRWTLDLAKQYNRVKPGYAVLYNTYQAYLKSTPDTLSKHLASALEEGFTLGIKLVRGAYLHSEPRGLIWDSKAETDDVYDGLTSDLLHRRYGSWLKAWNGADLAFPSINVVLATHNMLSVEKACGVRDAQDAATRDLVPLAYAQLQGMADEVSCELIEARRRPEESSADPPRTYKAAAWGTTKECLNYLLRRADENRDAMSRTVETRRAMGHELRRRLFTGFRSKQS